MIAKWIAQALMRGEDHLTLTNAELAKWQANGCRLSLGAPYGLHGQYAVHQIHLWHEQLVKLLLEIEPSNWPVGEIKVQSQVWKNTTAISLPQHDFRSAGDGSWIVPLVPEDVDHCLDAWSFDISLSTEECEAVRPIAHRLAKRMALRCELKSRQEAYGKDVLWSAGRLSLAELAGLEQIRLHVWFDRARSAAHRFPINAESIDRDDCVDLWRAEQSRLREISYIQETLNGPREIKSDGNLINELQINKVVGDQDSFTVRFTGDYSNTRPLASGVASFVMNLSRSELTKLKEFIEQSLGLVQVPLPVCEDIALMVLEAARKQEEQPEVPNPPEISSSGT